MGLRRRDVVPTREVQLMRISTIGIVTRGRPDALRRCIDSHVTCAQRFGRQLRFVVVDDSGIDDHRTYALTRALRREGLQIRRVGHEARAALAYELIARGVPREAAVLAVMRTSPTANMTGAARNALLLLTAGEPLVLSDDDVVCEPDREWDDARDQTPATPRDLEDPTVTTFLESEAQLGSSRSDVDVLRAYEHALSDDTVMCALPGLRGGSGMGLPYLRLVATRESLSSLIAASDYATAVGSDLVHRAPRCTTRTRGAYGFGAHVAVDNRQPLPPFAPAGRNQDGVFFALRCRLFPRSVTALLPFTVKHGSARTLTRAEIVESAGRVRANDFLVDRILRLPVKSRRAATSERAGVLGAHLVAHARSSTFESSFLSWYRVAHAEQRDRADAALAAIVDRARPALVDDLRAIRARLAAAAASTFVDRALVDGARDQVARVGALLVHWQALRAAAVSARASLAPTSTRCSTPATRAERHLSRA